MAEKILFEYRAGESGDSAFFNIKPCARAWNVCGPVLMSCCDWQAASMLASRGGKGAKLDDTLAFFEGMYRDIFGGEESK